MFGTQLSHDFNRPENFGNQRFVIMPIFTKSIWDYFSFLSWKVQTPNGIFNFSAVQLLTFWVCGCFASRVCSANDEQSTEKEKAKKTNNKNTANFTAIAIDGKCCCVFRSSRSLTIRWRSWCWLSFKAADSLMWHTSFFLFKPSNILRLFFFFFSFLMQIKHWSQQKTKMNTTKQNEKKNVWRECVLLFPYVQHASKPNVFSFIFISTVWQEIWARQLQRHRNFNYQPKLTRKKRLHERNWKLNRIIESFKKHCSWFKFVVF